MNCHWWMLALFSQHTRFIGAVVVRVQSRLVRAAPERHGHFYRWVYLFQFSTLLDINVHTSINQNINEFSEVFL